jgi:hypothetical protein
MNELTITGTALEPPRIEAVTRRGRPVTMSHFYFQHDGDEIKADATHVIYYGKPLAFSTGARLILIGRTQQDVWLTRENGKTYKIQDFVVHSVEAKK